MTTVTVRIDTGADAERTDQATRQLCQELLALDVVSATLPGADDAPAGAKGDPVTVGTIIVTLAGSPVLVCLCQLARTWITRDRDRRITITDGTHTIELAGGNTAQHQQLIDAFIKAPPDSRAQPTIQQ